MILYTMTCVHSDLEDSDFGSSHVVENDMACQWLPLRTMTLTQRALALTSAYSRTA